MKSVLLALAFAASLVVAPVVRADTMAFPNAENASFLIDYPSDWELTPAEEEGGYATLIGPTGILLMLRTIPGDESAMESAVKASYEYVVENYENVKLDEPKDSVQRGLTGFYGTGSGVDEDMGEVGFAMAWYALNDGTIGEIWYVVPKGDQTGSMVATKILDSFRAP